MTLEKCQIITHVTESLTFTPFDVKWIPCTAKCVVIGQHARGTGAFNIFELDAAKLSTIHSSEKPSAFKCCTLGASSIAHKQMATGDFDGQLSVWDLQRPLVPIYSTKAHEQIINAIDGCGGSSVNSGPPECVTASRDGFVKVWDIRQKEKPVAIISPAQGQTPRDAWAVSFGNSFNDQERCIATGYDNGDVKLFDLKNMSLVWETNVKNGVCALEFDRKDIKMNKLVVAGLESNFNVFDMRTQHPTQGFAHVTEKASGTTTVWTVKHLPQNRDIFMTSSGNGNLYLYKYNYPSKRSTKDKDGKFDEGVPGTVELLQKANVAEQPVVSFDWSVDKQGLCAYSAFDQTLRIGIVTKLNAY